MPEASRKPRRIPLCVYRTTANSPTVILGDYRVAGIKLLPSDTQELAITLDLESIKDAIADFERRANA